MDEATGKVLPTGTVTFLFSDIEGSTRLLARLGEAYRETLETHQRILREAFAAHDGIEISTEGDSFFCVFRSAPNALRAAVAAQRALAGHDWPPDVEVRVRIGIHTGEAEPGGDNYVGIDVHRAARIMAAGHGGQVVVSETTGALVGRSLPDGMSLRDLGEHRLKDLEHPARLFQVVAEGLPDEFPAPRTLDAERGNLPTQLTSFVGRRRELEDVKDALRRTRLLTLIGPGGTGKTRLAIQAATELRDECPDGAYFVALSSITDPELVVPAIRDSLGLREEADRSALDTVKGFLADSRVLLVIDNFEQVIAAAPMVGELLSAGEGVKVIATSREPLRVHGEAEYPVPPLPLPNVERLPPVESLQAYEAIALFVDRARAVKPSFDLTPDNASAVAGICVQLDGLPLAIELAAARVKVLSPEAILKRLRDRLSLLTGGARDLPSRQQTLRGAIEWSFDLLEEGERALFARVAVFFGGFTLEAAEAVCGPGLDLDMFDGIASLVSKSLLRQVESDGDARFFMLWTIWEYAEQRLNEDPEAPAVRARHAAFFRSLAEDAAPQIMGPRQTEMLDRLTDEHENLRVAIGWAMQNDVEGALRLGAALWRFWQMRGHLHEAAERVPAILDLPGAEDHPEARANALEAAGGVFYWMAQDWRTVERYYAECLDLRRRIGEPAGIAEALYNLAFAYILAEPPQQDLPRAQELYEESRRIFEEIGDTLGLAKSWWGLANAHIVQNHWQDAYDAAAASMDLYRTLDDRFGVGWAAYTMGMSAIFLERRDEAEEKLRQALDLFAAAEDLSGISLMFGAFALLRALQGDAERAARLWGSAEKLEQASGVGLGVGNWEWWIPWDPATLERELGAEAYQRIKAEGAAMSVEEAVAYALKED